MTTLTTTPIIGLEDVQRAAFYVFFERFNDVLSEVQSYWTSRDQIFDNRTGRSTSPTILEPLPPGNFHEGHKPSLITNEPESYPNLAVFAGRGDPSRENDLLDQVDSWSIFIMAEILVKGQTEDETNRRIQRTTEAAIICLRHNETLGGAVTGSEATPSVMISDLFAMRVDAKNGGYGDRLLWQGSQIVWRVRKDSAIPPPIGSIFENASTTDYSQYIDQG